MKNRPQPPGPQFGKDLQINFQTPDGNVYRWQIECKRHTTAAVRKEEILPKLFDLWKSDHQIDVWCIASAQVELGNALDEMITSLAGQLDLPFSIARLSPAENDIKSLFACEPDLYRRVYPDEPIPKLTEERKQLCIEQFEQFLLSASTEAKSPRGSRWQLVSQQSIKLEQDIDAWASGYLRGFEPGGWESIAYGWAIPRHSMTADLLNVVAQTTPGFRFCWIIGSAGEGKSTVLRQVAWKLGVQPDTLVLWGSAEADPLRFPDDWLQAISQGTRCCAMRRWHGAIAWCPGDAAHVDTAFVRRQAGDGALCRPRYSLAKGGCSSRIGKMDWARRGA